MTWPANISDTAPLTKHGQNGHCCLGMLYRATLVHVMAWCSQVPSHYLDQSELISITLTYPWLSAKLGGLYNQSWTYPTVQWPGASKNVSPVSGIKHNFLLNSVWYVLKNNKSFALGKWKYRDMFSPGTIEALELPQSCTKLSTCYLVLGSISGHPHDPSTFLYLQTAIVSHIPSWVMA